MKSGSYPDRHRTLGALLRAPWRVLEGRVYGAMAERGFPEVRPAHGVVFRHIEADGSRVSDLADRAGMAKQSMAYLVSHLEEHGYLRVGPDPLDGRAKRVILTERGEAVLKAAHDLSRSIEAEWALAIGAGPMETLKRDLGRLWDYLEAEDHQS
ncbi:MAG: MarR family transcriptional regulator [Rhodospirillum sp.]|nr:MarR family transcriptional regulator [Rhodospirillum sp.]MCF8488057.1 MarR family transcriptional regulator [Rhodospirillum sp.]MCF8501541.1 MarR family transcriptional regulator [Rhodospirillum sp.]